MSLLVKRTARSVFVLAMLPAVVLGQVSAEAILIHDHHGQDLHFHTLTLNDPTDPLERWRCEHEPSRRATDPLNEDCSTIVIVLELPDALPRVRGLSAGTSVAKGFAPSPVPVAATPDPAARHPSLYAHPWFAAPNLHAGSMVAGILLANHALLL